MLDKVQTVIKRFFWIPFVCAIVGYFFLNSSDGSNSLGFFEAVYASVALYFVNPVSDNQNAWILLAKLTAILVTTGFILSVTSTVTEKISHWFVKRHPDSTAVYTDSLWGKQIAETVKHGYLSKKTAEETAEDTNDHIIMFADDVKNLMFYENNKELLQKKRVFIELNKVDPFVLKESGEEDKNVHFFNVYEMMARQFWKTFHLYDEIRNHNQEEPYRIAILGYDDPGKAIFKYGYLNNIYAIGQRLEYHIWGCTAYDQKFLEHLNMGNEDNIVVHTKNYEEELELISGMQRVIVTEFQVLDVVQKLLLENPELPIYGYCEDEIDLAKVFKCSHLYTFGNTGEILTEENIKKEKLYQQAKLVNYDYYLLWEKKWEDSSRLPDDYEKEAEEAWRGLDGFTKGSNVARADFYWIEKKCLESGAKKDEVWKMEHIRWCRYHYYNRWKFEPAREDPETHKPVNKDLKKRTHCLLIPFKELPENEKKKDGVNNQILKEEIENLI